MKTISGQMGAMSGNMSSMERRMDGQGGLIRDSYMNTLILFCFCICIYVETCIYRVLFIEWVHLRTGSGIWNSDSKISGDGSLSDSWPDPGYDFYCLFDLPLIFGLPI